MSRATFRFHGELNFHLRPERQRVHFVYEFDRDASIKDVIEALGVPHTEVDLILIGGEPVDFTYLLRDGDQVEVYPMLQAADPRALTAMPAAIRFVLDQHLGRLAAYLRMLGFDTLYQNDYHDPELAAISNAQQRILLTRDRGLLKRRIVTYGYYVRETDPRRQVAEILERFKLLDKIAPFRRCLNCNGLIEPVAKAEIIDRLTPLTSAQFDEFYICRACDKIYWKGSHFERMTHLIEEIRQSNEYEGDEKHDETPQDRDHNRI